MRLSPLSCPYGSTFLLFLLSLTSNVDALVRRSGACAARTSSIPAKTTSVAPTPAPSCYLQNEDPDQGINERGCICGTKTLPLLTLSSVTDVSQSCSYTEWPSSKVSNPISIETQYYTNNCQACTLVGGLADTPTCTSVAKCIPTTTPKPSSSSTLPPTASGTFTVWLSNNSVPIGDENNKNNGTDLRTTMFSKLQALCPDNKSECDSTTKAAIDEIPTVVDDNPMGETLMFTIQDSSYDSKDNRDRMLAAVVATWQQATAKSCKEVTYEAYADQAATPGCGQGPVKKDLSELARFGAVKKRELDPREECQGVSECLPPPRKCTYTATVCSAPDHITTVMESSNGQLNNHMDVEVSWQLDGVSAFDEFLCDAIIDGLTDLAMAVAPELIEAGLLEEYEFDSLCADLAETDSSMNQRSSANSALIE